jgi:hypothetical protein
MQQHRYMTDMYVQQNSTTQPTQQSYTEPVMMERTPSTAFNGRLHKDTAKVSLTVLFDYFFYLRLSHWILDVSNGTTSIFFLDTNV